MWRMQTNFLVFGRRKLDFGKVLCFDTQILAIHLTSFVSYLSDGIFEPMVFPGQRCDDPVTVRIGSANVVNSYEEKLLGVQIDSKLSFDNHVSKLCQKASNKLYALARISPYMDQRKLRTLMRVFITSQFQYCPLIWMFHSRQLNKKLTKYRKGP